MARVDLSFDKLNTILIYKYEPFWYRISKPVGATGVSSTVSSGIPSSFLDVSTTSYADLSSAGGYNGATSTVESWTVNGLSNSNVIAVSSNPVSILPGRFLDSSDNSMSNNSFTFNLKEPFSSILFKSFINLQSTPIVTPTLPPGISFVPSGARNYYLTASPSPSVVLPTTNYQVIGKGAGVDVGKIVTTRFNLTVGQERVLLDLSGSSTVGPMAIGTAIADRYVTARYPPYPWAGSNLRYTWSGLPDGLTFANLSGVAQSSPYTPNDASSSIVLKGTPTVKAATDFANARIKTKTISLIGTRNIAPAISATQAFSFSFEPTVLFDVSTIPSLFTDVSVDPSASLIRAGTYFRASTYFEAGDTPTPITNIFSPNLISDLSLVFVSNQQIAYLTGKPTSPFNTNYTIRAINNLDVSRSVSVNFVSTDVSVNYDYSVTPSNNSLFTFVVSRPLSNVLPGYTYPIQFKTLNNAGLPVTYTASSLPIGVTLSNIGNNTVQLVGTPAAAFPQTNVDISASVAGTSASTTTRVRIAANNDVYTFNNPGSLSFIQNRAITPFQISATTLSERNVLQYRSTDIPPNLIITNRGIVSGTDISSASGSFNVTASTGYTQGSGNFPFTVTPDTFFLFVATTGNVFSIPTGSAVSIPIRGISFSGIPVNQFSIPDASCPFVIDSTSGIITAKTGVYVPPITGSYTYTILGWSSNVSVGFTPAGQLSMTLTVPTRSFAYPSTLQFSASPAGGPTFTSPAATNYLLYQYVPITPIVLAATGSTPIRMYVAIGDLPIGLTFDPATQTISGTPAFVGYDEVLIYAQDVDSKYTSIRLNFTTILPTILRKHTSAGAYTSLVRQYTAVNAAQNARNNLALPAGETSLGEFMSPHPPDVVSPPSLFLTDSNIATSASAVVPAYSSITILNYYQVTTENWNTWWYPSLTDSVALNSSITPLATISTMGATLTDTYKYTGGVLAPNGKIYGIPGNSTNILIIDPVAGTATRSTMGVSLAATGNKWIGGVLASNGKIYGIPTDTTDILIIDPVAGTATRSTMGASLTGTDKWKGGILAPNGKIYCIPNTATDILIIDPVAGSATRSTMGASLSGVYKWEGGVLAPNGKIYGIPNFATDILIIDPASGTATRSTMGASFTGSDMWVGGVLAPNGKIYCMPNTATDILIIDPVAGTATRSTMGASFTGSEKWASGVLGPDGKIYGIPQNSNDVLIINPVAGTATRSTMGLTFTGNFKWYSGTLAGNGAIYAMPQSYDGILKIGFTPTPVVYSDVLLTPYFNKF